MRQHYTPHIRSRIQVRKKGVTVDRGQWHGEHGVDCICGEGMQLWYLDQGILQTSMAVMSDTHGDNGQEGEHGCPDSRIHCEDGEALQNVCSTCRQKSMIRRFPSLQLCTYLANPVVSRLRTSMYVRKMAIITSTPAATDKDTVSALCSPDTEVFGSGYKTYPYHKCMVIEISEQYSLHAGSE